MITTEITIAKMSTEYFRTLSWALDRYGSWLKDFVERDPFSNESKDYSICLTTFFKVEPKISKKELLKPESDRSRQNKSLKIPVHSGIVILEAMQHVDHEKDFSQCPALEHIKEQISKQII